MYSPKVRKMKAISRDATRSQAAKSAAKLRKAQRHAKEVSRVPR